MREPLTRADVIKIVTEARARGERPDLSGADLSGANLSEAIYLSEANLSGADLRGANLSRANLSWANLSGADLRGANLRGASLSRADLSGANLSEANLSWANLSGANLSRANLRGANLSLADLSWANLSEANLSGADLRGAKNIPEYVCAVTSIIPAGEIVGWKKLRGDLICKLLIPADARRSNATGRKCRCDKAKVVEIWDGDQQVQEGVSKYDDSFIYHVGEWVSVHDFDEDRWNECSAGIHFFITRFEAQEW